jgi:hypothetical protein
VNASPLMSGPAPELALRDIHLPAPISWWLIPPGYYLIALASLLLAGLLFYLYKKYESYKFRRLALKELESIASAYKSDKELTKLIKVFSIWLRRSALCHYPRSACAGLTGKRWLEFLDNDMVKKPFTKGVGRVFALGPYSFKALEVDCDGEELIALGKEWVKTLPPIKKTKASPNSKEVAYD